MNQAGKLRIWHVGNWCIHIGQKYVESPFEAPSKDVEVLNYAQPLIDALLAIPDTEVVSQPSWELYHISPEVFEERLRWATTIIFADVETKCLMLHPDFFQRAKWGDEPLVFPDRFDLLREWVMGGGHFHMNGGWLSFGGELGKGGWAARASTTLCRSSACSTTIWLNRPPGTRSVAVSPAIRWLKGLIGKPRRRFSDSTSAGSGTAANPSSRSKTRASGIPCWRRDFWVRGESRAG
jgi:uncharacterized membrane protein